MSSSKYFDLFVEPEIPVDDTSSPDDEAGSKSNSIIEVQANEEASSKTQAAIESQEEARKPSHPTDLKEAKKPSTDVKGTEEATKPSNSGDVPVIASNIIDAVGDGAVAEGETDELADETKYIPKTVKP